MADQGRSLAGVRVRQVGASGLALAVALATAFVLASLMASSARAQTPTTTPTPTPTASAQPIPVPFPGRGAFAGVPPLGAGIAMLVTSDTTTAQALTTSLGDTGCVVETIAVLRPPSFPPGGPPPLPAVSEWTPFVAGAPAAANEGFVRVLPTIPSNTPFFLRCRAAISPAIDPANARYRIGSTVITLVDGRSDIEAAPGSAGRIVTQLTDRRSYGDLDGGVTDAAVALTYSGGGSGTFTYLGFQSGAQPASVGPTVLLGDRVTVTGLSVAHGRIMVTYLDRRPAEALTILPTLPVTKLFAVTGGTLVEIGSVVG